MASVTPLYLMQSLSDSPILYPVHPWPASSEMAPSGCDAPPAPSGSAESSEDFRYWAVRDFHAAYSSKKVTPTKVIERLLAAIRKSDANSFGLHAFSQVNETDALRQAKLSDRNVELGIFRPLEGIPVAIKGELAVAGYERRLGTTFINRGVTVSKDEESQAGNPSFFAVAAASAAAVIE